MNIYTVNLYLGAWFMLSSCLTLMFVGATSGVAVEWRSFFTFGLLLVLGVCFRALLARYPAAPQWYSSDSLFVYANTASMWAVILAPLGMIGLAFPLRKAL